MLALFLNFHNTMRVPMPPSSWSVSGGLECVLALTSLPGPARVSIKLPGPLHGPGRDCEGGTRAGPPPAHAWLLGSKPVPPSFTQQVGEWEREGWMGKRMR